MTERTASGRALAALKAIGMEEAPLTTLEREDALFVLTAQTLVYQDGGGTRRVTLRDLTRIHSDEQGVLRVETPAGTALTASLLGFDVAGVQAFFAQVRNTTARAKEMPASPLPTPGAFKTFGASAAPPPPETGRKEAADAPAKDPGPPAPQAAAPAPASAGQRAPTPLPEGAPAPKGAAPGTEAATAQAASPTPQPEPAQTSRGGGSEGERAPADPPGPGRAPLPPAPRPAGTVESPAARPAPLRPSPASPPGAPAAPDNGQTAAAPARPVVISSSAFTPTSARAASAAPEAPRAAPVPAAVPPAVGEAPLASPSAPVAPPPMLDGLHRTLARQAEVVSGLVGRLRFLGGVLFVAALLLSLVQFTADARLDALWTLLSGGVGTIALLTLAELARLLALLGRSAALSADAPGGGMDAR